MPMHAPLRAVPFGFWGILLGTVLVTQGLSRGPPLLAPVGAALLLLGGWQLARWYRRKTGNRRGG